MRPAFVLKSPKRSTPESTANCTKSCASPSCPVSVVMEKKSLFKLTSLNLNGIRSAASKGVEGWLARSRPDCICVQEVKAHASDVEGKYDALAGLRGHFHYA